MFKIAAVFTLVLLLASGAWAAIGLTEGFYIGGTNQAGLIGGGLVESTNFGTVGQVQEVINSTGSLFAAHKQDGTLVQTASTKGQSGCSYGCCKGSENSVWQGAEAWGAQDQFAAEGCLGSIGTASQELGVGLDTNVSTKHGKETTAYQGFFGSQDQITVTPAGVSIQEQAAEATQLVDIGNSYFSQANVSNTLNVQGSQSQVVIGQ